MPNTQNNHRIAKNTAVLYVRLLLTLGISLYTSRVLLNTLGVEDFGIYNIVGSIVILLSFLNNAMSSATQRFLSFELGKNDYEQLKRVFNMSVNIHVIIAIIIFILAETIGLWFLNNRLVIPAERLSAANWVYQFTILSFITTVISVPYNAIIIAHERMNIYAYISIIETVLKLIAVLTLVWCGCDKLKMYAILMFCVFAIILTIYKAYCKYNFPESNYRFFLDKILFKTLMGYAGWNLFGNLALIIMGQGINILLNLFFGPVVNAAWGIAFQVSNIVSLFSYNIRMAVNPQIVKSCAAGNKGYMNKLVFESAKYSFYLLLLIALPMLLETNMILSIWLRIVPANSILFCQLALINILIQCFDASFSMVFQAIGKIKENQLLSGGTFLLVLPVSYIFLKWDFSPQTVFYVQIAATILVAFIIKIVLLSKQADINVIEYFRRLIFPVLKVTTIAVFVPILIKINMNEGILRLLIVGFSSFASLALSVYYLGLSKEIRLKINKALPGVMQGNWLRKKTRTIVH